MMSGLVMLLSPGHLAFGGYEFKIFTWEDVFSTPQPKVDIAEIVAFEEQIDDQEKAAEIAAKQEPKLDTTGKETPFQPTGAEVGELKRAKVPIEFPQEHPEALNRFFASLDRLSSSDELIRIVHYGDSQLEGDRISDYLRNRLQKRFGGCGVGWVPILDINNLRSSIKMSASKNWIKYACYGADRKQPIHKSYGLLGSYFTLYDQVAQPATGEHSGQVTYLSAKGTYERFNYVEKVKLFYRNRRETLGVSFHMNDSLVSADTLGIQQGFGVKTYTVNQEFRNAHFEFFSTGNPDIFGVAFDCNRGIAVDNVAMRGSSGLEFTQINNEFLAEQLKEMRVKLLIVQYGVNVIPTVLDNYKFYENSLIRQLNYLKSLAPDMDILVVGVSDMSRKAGTGYETYPNVELVRNAQKAAAFKAGCAFWDLYRAMGGHNSMVSWVAANPPLGSSDYTHFTPRGARLVGEMMYSELIALYEAYRENPPEL